MRAYRRNFPGKCLGFDSSKRHFASVLSHSDKILTDLCKTVETVLDPRLDLVDCHHPFS